MQNCPIDVNRQADGSGFVTVTLPDGRKRAIFFEKGQPTGYDASQADGDKPFSVGKKGDLNIILIGDERYEIPDAVFTTSQPTKPQQAVQSPPASGTPVNGLKDLVGAKARQAESVVIKRGYQAIKRESAGDSTYSYWKEPKTGFCVTIRTQFDRYQSIAYASALDCQAPQPTSSQTTEETAAARAGQGKFDATGQIPCAQNPSQPMIQCKFGVAREGNGNAAVVVTKPDGKTRAIFFVEGKANSADTSQADGYGEFKAERVGDLNKIQVGNERYEIPDAVIFGG
jgi:hypothetical protein